MPNIAFALKVREQQVRKTNYICAHVCLYSYMYVESVLHDSTYS